MICVYLNLFEHAIQLSECIISARFYPVLGNVTKHIYQLRIKLAAGAAAAGICLLIIKRKTERDI